MKDWLKQILTKILSNGFLVILIVAVFYILYLRECKRPPACPPEGKVLIEQSAWDSIKALANKPAIVHIDTIYIKGDPVLVPGIPTSNLPDIDPDSLIFSYEDSLIRADINVKYSFVTEGKLLAKEWSYIPIQTNIHRIDSIPYPVYIKGDPYEVKISQRGLYINGSAGGNANAFIFGGGLDYIT